MSDWLFAYGSLLPGRENAHILAPLAGHWEPGHVRGILSQGTGDALGWPVLILDNHGQRVNGQLFYSTALREHWPYLDAFEGPAYRRVLAAVTRADGSTREACVYVGRPAPAQS